MEVLQPFTWAIDEFICACRLIENFLKNISTPILPLHDTKKTEL